MTLIANRLLLALVPVTLIVAACSSENLSSDDPSSPGDDDPGSPGDPNDPAGGDPDDDDTLPTYPVAHPRIYLTPNRARLEAALAANTPAAVKFKAKVDQWVGGVEIWGFNPWNAALLGQLTGNPSYCSAAVAAVEAQVSAAESAIAGGGKPAVAGDSYLEIGELVGDLALVYDWCFDQVSSSQRTRWLAYANQAIWNVWHHEDAEWGGRAFPWSGWSVDNPSNNYYYSFLRATMLVGLAAKGESPQADEWITQFREAKIFGQLVPTFESDLDGGGSREGTGYGVAMRRLFELYDFWKATTGESLATKTSHTRASMHAFVHQIVPTLDRVAPTGDHARDATGAFFDYHRNYLQELVTLFPNDPAAGPATTLLASASIAQMSSGFMLAYDFLYDSEVAAEPMAALPNAYHAPGIGQLYARSGWDTHATWINLIAGPYTESHAHQDQGSIMIFKDGWLAHDANIHSRSGLAQETGAHGLVRIDSGGQPVRQIASTMSELVALHAGDGWLHAAADVTAAYNGNAAVELVQRELVYLQPDVVIVFDRVRTTSGTTQTWQLPVPVQPSISGTTATIISAGHALALTRIAPASATVSTHAYSGSEFSGGFRLDARVAGGDQRYLHVLAIDNAASSVVAAGTTGVTVRLADHRLVTVAFDRDAVGATLTIDGVATTLAAGVDSLPE